MVSLSAYFVCVHQKSIQVLGERSVSEVLAFQA